MTTEAGKRLVEATEQMVSAMARRYSPAYDVVDGKLKKRFFADMKNDSCVKTVDGVEVPLTYREVCRWMVPMLQTLGHTDRTTNQPKDAN